MLPFMRSLPFSMQLDSECTFAPNITTSGKKSGGLPPGAAPFLNTGSGGAGGLNDSAAQAAQQAKIDAVFASAGATNPAPTHTPTGSTYSNAHLRPSFEKVRLSSRGLRDHSSYDNHDLEGPRAGVEDTSNGNRDGEEDVNDEYDVDETGEDEENGEVSAGGRGNNAHKNGFPPPVDVSNISFESGKSYGGGNPLSSSLDPRLRAAYAENNQEPTFERTSDNGSEDGLEEQPGDGLQASNNLEGDASKHERSDNRGRPLERPPHSPQAPSSPTQLPSGPSGSETTSTATSSSNVPRFEQLYAQHAASAKKARERKAQAEAAQVAACTFAPILATRDRSGSRDRSASRGRHSGGSVGAKVDSNNRRRSSRSSSRDDNAGAAGAEGAPHRTSPLHDKVADLIAKRRARSTSATPPVPPMSSDMAATAAGDQTAEAAVNASPTVDETGMKNAETAKNEEEEDDESKEGDVASASEDESNEEDEQVEDPELATAHDKNNHHKEFARSSRDDDEHNKDAGEDDHHNASVSTSNRMTPVNSDEESDTDSSIPAHLLSGGLHEADEEIPQGGSRGGGKKGGFLNRMKEDLARRSARAAER
jgi:hypothetical protein